MTYSMNREGSRLTVTVAGNLDTLTSPELEKGLAPALGGITELVLDFAGLEYISSAGLRILMGAAQVMSKQGEMTVAHVRPEVMDVFRLTRFTDILHIV